MNAKTRTPLISVVVAAWNQEKFIDRCIRSLLSQNFSRDNFEIIVVNDGSTDRTKYALDIFEDDILVLHNEKNCALPASLNRAIKKIKSPFFGRVDADDFVSSNFPNVRRVSEGKRCRGALQPDGGVGARRRGKRGPFCEGIQRGVWR
jgi:cellulose synthase/poly-beta-1,6-N-acetylglucosamine synthase-like glycosyltransferase